MNKPPMTGVSKPVVSYIEYLENKIEKYEESPLVDSYLALHSQIQRWNRQLTEAEIDLFSPASKDIFAMAHKYLTEQKPYIDQLEYLRKLMSPEEQKELKEKIKMDNLGIAEKLALGGK